MKSQIYKLALLSILILTSISFVFGQTEREKGIEFFKKADYKSAIDSLNVTVQLNKTDAESWNMLGMAYFHLVKFKESRKALENAVKYSPVNVTYLINLAYINLASNKLGTAENIVQKAIQLDAKNSEAYYVRGAVNFWKGKYDKAILDADEAIKINPNMNSAYILKSDSYLYRFGEQIYKSQKPGDYLDLLEKSIETLDNCLKNCSKTSALQTIQTKLDQVKAFNTHFSRKKDEIFGQVMDVIPDPTITPLKILSKPKALYTDSARQAAVQGTTTLAVLFAADGKTKTILVVKPLSNGLTEEAIRASHAFFTRQTPCAR